MVLTVTANMHACPSKSFKKLSKRHLVLGQERMNSPSHITTRLRHTSDVFYTIGVVHTSNNTLLSATHHNQVSRIVPLYLTFGYTCTHNRQLYQSNCALLRVKILRINAARCQMITWTNLPLKLCRSMQLRGLLIDLGWTG